ncbi:MAG: F0F1 ATP synthase subunit B [Endomicrobium sp.]|jgi:F-type H+-transporting ATPase subunit b|nr:F0F1 ATP synthase subunit B [Endomicrobium sp.]
MGMIQNFGLETKLFLFQLINFLIIVFILKKFLFNPLKKMLDERKRKIEQSLQDAQNAKLALENAGQEKKKILADAKVGADKLMASVKAIADKAKEKALAEAKSRSQQIIEEANNKASAEFENMNKQIGRMSVDVSNKILSKVLSDLFTEEEKQKLMSRALERINEKITN